MYKVVLQKENRNDFILINANNVGTQFIACFILPLQLCLFCSIILAAGLVNCTEGQFDTIHYRHLAYNRSIQVPQDHFTNGTSGTSGTNGTSVTNVPSGTFDTKVWPNVKNGAHPWIKNLVITQKSAADPSLRTSSHPASRRLADFWGITSKN
jgi:hypothetical protein